MKIKKTKNIYRDGYVKKLEKAGTRARDITSRVNGFYEVETRLDYMQCATIYKDNAIARNAVDNIVKYVFKNGLTLSIPSNPELQKRVMKVWEEGDYVEVVKSAMLDGLVSGHAMIFCLLKNQNPTKPFNKRLLRGKKVELVKVDGRYITTTPDLRILSKTYNQPITYYANSQQFDPSWVQIFNAITPSDYLKPLYKYMGMSYFEAAFQSIINDEIISRAIPNLVYRSSIVNYKLNGFANAIKNGSEQDVLKYVQVSEDYKSFLNATVCDAQDTVEVISRELSGLDGLDQRSIYRLSAGFKQPATILLGKSPDGMNATGDKDMEAFYNYVEEWQQQWLPQIKWVFELLIAADKENEGEDVEFDLKFNKVNMVSPEQKANADAVILDNAVKMRDLGLPEEAVYRHLLENKIITEEEAAYMDTLKEEIEANEDPLENENQYPRPKITPRGKVEPYRQETEADRKKREGVR